MKASSKYYEQDGTTYLLSAQPIGLKWVGKWQCDICKIGGESSPEYDTEQIAYDAASSNLQEHHIFYHKK